MLLKDWIKEHQNRLPASELYYLLKNLFEESVVDDELVLLPFVLRSLNWCLQLRCEGMPLSKIFHKKWFYNDCFLTTLDTLDPRPETEYLIEKIDNTPRTILELGVGTGCVLLSIVKKFYRAKGVGVDISHAALNVAKKNAKLLDLEKKVEFKLNNWAYGLRGEFDLVVCNPPYVSKEADLSKETLYDPALALFGTIDVYRDVLQSLSDIKFKQLLFEVPKDLLSGVVELLSDWRLECFQVYDTDIYVISVFV